MKILSTEELNNRLLAGPVALFDVRGDVAYDRRISPRQNGPEGSQVIRAPETRTLTRQRWLFRRGETRRRNRPARR
jgi:hypothetical protein